MTETLPFTVLCANGPILIGLSPGVKLIGKDKWDSPFLKHVTDDGMGVDVAIFFLNV